MDITAVQFGILSPEEILNISVCEVKYDKQKKLSDLENTLNDPRMGTIDDDKPCPTCKKEAKLCPGHFGHINLNVPIVYPLTFGFKTVLNILKCVCFNCSRLVFTEEKLHLLGLDVYTGAKKYETIVEESARIEICWNCKSSLAKFSTPPRCKEQKIIMFYKVGKDEKENSPEVSTENILRVFQGIPDSDIALLGFNPSRFRPKNLIITVLPVLPLCSRPYVYVDDEKRDDDLTTIYRDIIKKNVEVVSKATEVDRQKALKKLIENITALFNNSKKKVKQPNGREKKGIAQRLATKGGLFRTNLLGKRTNYSGRTVVGGDPTLDADEIVVPDCIAMTVTIPERVCSFNYDHLSRIVNSKQAEFVIRKDDSGIPKKIKLSIRTQESATPVYFGDRVYRRYPDGEEREVLISDLSEVRNGDRIVRKSGEIVESASSQRTKFFKLQIGDEVYRHLRNGDFVLVNRQPTLHMGSMLGVRVRRQPEKEEPRPHSFTNNFLKGFHPEGVLPRRVCMDRRYVNRRSIGIPLNITTPQNCDFDGKLHCHQQ